MLLVDSDIIIDGARGEEQAKEFLRKCAEQHVLAISTITRLELLAGCRNAHEWTLTEATVRQFSELELTPEISRIAVSLFEKYRLSHGIAMAWLHRGYCIKYWHSIGKQESAAFSIH